MMCCAPTSRPSCSAASIPFWIGSTTVSGPMKWPIPALAALVSYVLTQNSTRSTAPISCGSLVAWTGSVNVPARRDFTVRPCVRRASNCVPRARKVTSSPALASSPPKYPPVPPAPMTLIRICSLLCCGLSEEPSWEKSFSPEQV